MKNIAQALINEAQATGSVDLSVIGCGGAFLNSQENIMAEPWYKDEEQRGGFDAIAYKFWITTDNGMEPDGYDAEEQLSEFLNKFRSNMPENFVPIFSIGVERKPRGNHHGFTSTDYAISVSAEINKMAGDIGRSGDYDWFERKLSEYEKSIGFDLLFIKLDELFEVE